MKHLPSVALCAALASVAVLAPSAHAQSINYDEGTNRAFLTIDEPFDGTYDLALRFGGTLLEYLTFDRTADRFELSNDLRVVGNIEAMGSMSGASIRSFGLVDCDDGTGDKLLWDSSTGTFSCGTDQSGGGGTSAYFSLTTESNSTASSALYDIFQSSSYAALTTTTNASSGITYTPSDGRFTVDNDGTYVIALTMILNSSSSNLTNIIASINGASFYTHDIYIHSSVDPVVRSINIIKSLNANDYLEFSIDALSSNTVSAYDGTSVSIHTVD